MVKLLVRQFLPILFRYYEVFLCRKYAVLTTCTPFCVKIQNPVVGWDNAVEEFLRPWKEN